MTFESVFEVVQRLLPWLVFGMFFGLRKNMVELYQLLERKAAIDVRHNDVTMKHQCALEELHMWKDFMSDNFHELMRRQKAQAVFIEEIESLKQRIAILEARED